VGLYDCIAAYAATIEQYGADNVIVCGVSAGGNHAAALTLRPARRRRCIDHIRAKMAVSERRVCRVLGQHRSTQREVPRGADEAALTRTLSRCLGNMAVTGIATTRRL
jgi:carboxylesterase type B